VTLAARALLVAVSAVLVMAAAGAQGWLAAQSQAPLAGGAVAHVGVVVRDVERAAREYADLFGVPVPVVRDVPAPPFPQGTTGDRRAHPRVAHLQLANTAIELLEPVGGSSPWRDHLDRYGESLHHIAFTVPDVPASVDALVKAGGAHVLGDATYVAAYVDMRPVLGFTVELIRGAGASAPAPASPAPAPSRLGTGRVGHIGIFVRDVDTAATLMARLMGMNLPPLVKNTARRVFPRGYDGDLDAHPKMYTFRESTLPLEFAEPQGGRSPWRNHVDKYGPSIHHVALAIDGMAETVGYTESKGGTVVLGPGPGYAFVEMPALGIAFELNGK
jgi:catechol 2,3-dioxygenase-like lactoylglutathione lyase family enzyme